MQTNPQTNDNLSFDDFKKEVLNDYKLPLPVGSVVCLGRREVLNGKG